MYQEVNEKIKVLALFEAGRIIPKALRWGNRKFIVDKVDLEYQEREGESINYFFAVSANNGIVFKLSYNSHKLLWTLKEYWLE